MARLRCRTCGAPLVIDVAETGAIVTRCGCGVHPVPRRLPTLSERAATTPHRGQRLGPHPKAGPASRPP